MHVHTYTLHHPLFIGHMAIIYANYIGLSHAVYVHKLGLIPTYLVLAVSRPRKGSAWKAFIFVPHQCHSPSLQRIHGLLSTDQASHVVPYRYIAFVSMTEVATGGVDSLRPHFYTAQAHQPLLYRVLITNRDGSVGKGLGSVDPTRQAWPAVLQITGVCLC